MRIIAIVMTFCLLGIVQPAQSDELNNEKKATIKELLQITGANEMGELFGNAFVNQMIMVLKKEKPDIDPKAFDIIRDEIGKFMHEEFIEKESMLPYIYPVYHKYLTLDEMKGLIDFYKTPLGKKAISVMPQMTREGMMAGQEWGKAIAPKLQAKIRKRLKEEGVEIKK